MDLDVKQLKADLLRDEGQRQFPYVDTAGKITIGVGRNLTDVGLSSDEISYLLATDVNIVLAELQRVYPWLEDHPEPVRRAFANMVFNMGINSFATFVNSIALVKARKYGDAADAFLKSKWAAQVKGRAQRVTDLIRTAGL